MVAVGVDQGAVQGTAAPDDHAVARGGDISAHSPQAFRDGGDPVGFLDFELGRVANDGLAFRGGRHDCKDRQFINQGRDQAAFNDCPFQGGGPDQQVRGRFTLYCLVHRADVGAHGFCGLEDSGPGRIGPGVPDQQF